MRRKWIWQALEWNAQGKRTVARPRSTWRKSVSNKNREDWQKLDRDKHICKKLSSIPKLC